MSGCQSLLGIHQGGKAPPADAGSSAKDGAGGSSPDGSPLDAPTDGADQLSDSSPATEHPVADAALDVAGEGGPVDAGADAARDASADAGTCVAPWHAENVPALILTPNPIGATACSIAGSEVPSLAAAVDLTNFRGAQACGACLRVQGTTGSTSLVVPVVERSGAAGILLTRAAMDQLAPGAGLIAVDWSLVPCPVGSQPVRYLIKEGTNAAYLGVQIRNARYPIASVAVVGSHATVPLALQIYNYWESTAAGLGPVTFRITDINGQAIDDSGIKLDPATEVTGQGQFPLCH